MQTAVEFLEVKKKKKYINTFLQNILAQGREELSNIQCSQNETWQIHANPSIKLYASDRESGKPTIIKNKYSVSTSIISSLPVFKGLVKWLKGSSLGRRANVVLTIYMAYHSVLHPLWLRRSIVKSDKKILKILSTRAWGIKINNRKSALQTGGIKFKRASFQAGMVKWKYGIIANVGSRLFGTWSIQRTLILIMQGAWLGVSQLSNIKLLEYHIKQTIIQLQSWQCVHLSMRDQKFFLKQNWSCGKPTLLSVCYS